MTFTLPGLLNVLPSGQRFDHPRSRRRAAPLGGIRVIADGKSKFGLAISFYFRDNLANESFGKSTDLR
jgi:hypothetical protein